MSSQKPINYCNNCRYWLILNRGNLLKFFLSITVIFITLDILAIITAVVAIILWVVVFVFIFEVLPMDYSSNIINGPISAIGLEVE